MNRIAITVQITVIMFLTACGVREVRLTRPAIEPQAVQVSPDCAVTLTSVSDKRTQSDPSASLPWLHYQVDDLPAMVTHYVTEWFGSHGMQLLYTTEPVDPSRSLGLSILRFYIEQHPSTVTTTIVMEASSPQYWGADVVEIVRGRHTYLNWLGSVAEFQREFKQAIYDATDRLWSKIPSVNYNGTKNRLKACYSITPDDRAASL